MRLMLVEALIVSWLGAAVGVLLAMWGIPALMLIDPTSVFRTIEVGINRQVLLFAASTTIATGLAAGLLPALYASRPGLAWMTHSAAQARESFAMRSPRGVLVVAEVALALVLLTGAGLVVKSFGRLLAVDPGSTGRVMLAGLSLPQQTCPTDPDRNAFYRAALSSLGTLGVVEGAALTTNPH